MVLNKDYGPADKESSSDEELKGRPVEDAKNQPKKDDSMSTSDNDNGSSGGQKKKSQSTKPKFSFMDWMCITAAWTSCTFLIFAIRPQTAPAGTTDNAILISTLNFTIYALYGLACFFFYKELKKIVNEKFTVDQVHSSAVDIERNCRDKLSRPRLKQLRDLVPFEYVRSTNAGRLISRILDDAEDYIYDERESILAPYRQQLHQQLKRFESLQSYALRLGILGTFIGLILAISELAGMVNFSAPASPNEVGQTRSEMFVSLSSQLFDAMKFAFGTSVAGLSVSLLVAILTVYLNRKLKSVINSCEDAASIVISLARKSTYEDKGILSSFAQIKNVIEIQTEEVQSQVGKAMVEMNFVKDTIHRQNQSLEDGIEVLSKMQTQWQSYVGIMRKHQSEMVDLQKSQIEDFTKATESFKKDTRDEQTILLNKMRESMSAISPDKLGSDIKSSVAELSSSIDDKFTQLVTDFNKLHADVVEKQTSNNEQAAKELNGLLVKMNKSTDSCIELTEQLKQGNELDALFKLQSTMSDNMPKLMDTQKQLTESVKELRNNPIDRKVTEKLKSIGEGFVGPLTEQLKLINNRSLDLETNLANVEQSNQTLCNELTTLNKRNKDITARISSFSFKAAVATNSAIGLILTGAGAVGIVILVLKFFG